MADEQNAAVQAWEELSEGYDADLITYFGPIQSPHDRVLLSTIERRKKLRKNVIFWLATFGGDPHAAYRISRTLQRHYKTTSEYDVKERGTFTVFVDTMCKSAGGCTAGK